MLDHPLVHKVAATIAAATIVGLGGVGWNTSHKVTQLEHASGDVTKTLSQIERDVRATRDTTAEIRTDVAVLKERTRGMESK